MKIGPNFVNLKLTDPKQSRRTHLPGLYLGHKISSNIMDLSQSMRPYSICSTLIWIKGGCIPQKKPERSWVGIPGNQVSVSQFTHTIKGQKSNGLPWKQSNLIEWGNKGDCVVWVGMWDS